MFSHIQVTVFSQVKAGAGQIGVYSDELIPGLRRLTEAIHAGGAMAGIQITHAGRLAMATKVSKDLLFAPSDVELKGVLPDRVAPPCTTATHEAMDRVLKAFVSAAIRGKQAGFDFVQLHMAHGYMLSEWLSPMFNKRTDEHGGSLENRLKWPLQVTKRILNT